jgi:hypothetical protein
MDFSNIARQLNEGESLDAAAASAEKATAGGQKQKESTKNSRQKQKSQMATQTGLVRTSDVSYTSEGYKPLPADKITRKVKALDAEKGMGMGSRKKDKRRMKMDMAVFVDKDPELRGMHRSAKQTVEKENRERGRKKMEEQRSEREYAKMISNESSDWRKELIEAAQPDEEGNHPYVDVMPFMNQKQQEVKKQMKGAVKAGERQQSDAMQPSGMSEGLSVEDQMKVSQDYFKKRAARSPEEKASEKKSEAQSRAKTYAMHKKPDPYKARAGESD